MKKITANDISRQLIGWVQSSGAEICIPNYYYGPYEMDLFRLTTSGYVYEYEIKVSLQDFRKDLAKSQKVYNRSETKKHETMASGTATPNKFYFVVPENLVPLKEIPPYAGLICFCRSRPFLKTIKPAPFIHRNPFPQDNYKKIALSLSWREIRLRSKIIRLTKPST